MWPRHYPEMPLDEEIVAQAKAESEQAVIILGRSSGEDRENVLQPGSYYLTEDEKRMLKLVTKEFPDAVLLLNIGAVMDLSFLEEYCSKQENQAYADDIIDIKPWTGDLVKKTGNRSLQYWVCSQSFRSNGCYRVEYAFSACLV